MGSFEKNGLDGSPSGSWHPKSPSLRPGGEEAGLRWQEPMIVSFSPPRFGGGAQGSTKPRAAQTPALKSCPAKTRTLLSRELSPRAGKLPLLLHTGHMARWPEMAQNENISDSSHNPEWILRAGKFHGGEVCWGNTLEPGKCRGSCPSDHVEQRLSALS